jgi:hypothetical protein
VINCRSYREKSMRKPPMKSMGCKSLIPIGFSDRR